MLGHPAQLGHGDGRERHGADRLRPPLRAAEFGHEVGRGPSGTRVVPQQRVAHRSAPLVQGDQPVLLAGDRDGVHVRE